MRRNRNISIIKALLRITGGLLIVIISAYIGDLFYSSDSTKGIIPISIIITILSLLYVFGFERKLANIEDDLDPDRLKYYEMLFEYKDKILSIIVIIVGILGLTLALTHSIVEAHYVLGICLVSTLIGIQIRKSFHKVNLGLLTNERVIYYTYYLIFILITTATIIVLLVFYNKSLVIGFLIGIPVGITATSLQILIKKIDFKNKLFASQDNFLITKFPFLNEKESLFRPAQLYYRGKSKKCLKVLSKMEYKLKEEEQIKLHELKYRCYLRTKKYKKAFDIYNFLATRNITVEYKTYLQTLLPIFKKDFEKTHGLYKKIAKDIQSYEPIVSINYSYTLNKYHKYKESKEILNNLIRTNAELNPIIKLFSINNLCYSTTRHILSETKFFALLSNKYVEGEPYKYPKKHQIELINTNSYLNIAFNINTRLKYRVELKNFNTHEHRIFILNETKSLLDFALGNFDEAITLINRNLRVGHNRSSTYKLLAIYNAVVGNTRTAKLNHIEFKAHEKSNIEENNETYERDDKLIEKLICKSGREVSVLLRPELIGLE